MIRENQKYFNGLQVFLDIFIILISFVGAYITRFYIMDDGVIALSFERSLSFIIATIPVYLLLYSWLDLYSSKRIKSLTHEATKILGSNTIGLLVLMAYLYLLKELDFARYVLFYFFAYNCILTVSCRSCVRLFLRKYRKKGYNLKHCLIIGTCETSSKLIRKLHKNPFWGYNVIGVVSTETSHPIQWHDTNLSNDIVHTLDEAASTCLSKEHNIVDLNISTYDETTATKDSNFCGHKIIGNISNLPKLLESTYIDIVMIATEEHNATQLGYIISSCEKAGIKTQIVPYYYKYVPARPYIDDLDGLPIIDTRHIPLDNLFKNFLKRSFDIVFSLFAILLTSPLLLFSAIMVKCTSPGPIIFKQERVGLDRKTFNMYKFRSMRLQTDEEEMDKWTTKNDPRKTWWGNFMRKTSIDELPQFFNVLKGDMSVIGPRPERPFFVDKFKEEIPRYMIKHLVRPGITGWAQVNGLRGDTSIEDRIEHDLYYIENWTFGLDLKIIILTIFKGFINKNAY